METGKNRAIPITRAVENGVYVLLSNFVGSHLGMVSLGNSLLPTPMVQQWLQPVKVRKFGVGLYI